MAYNVFEVAFGEQPSATKWNILGDNDASINDGSGINPANNQWLSWQGDNPSTRQGIIKLGDDDLIKFGSVWYQDNLFNNNKKKNDVTIFSGWTYVQPDGTSPYANTANIELPVEYDEWMALIVDTHGSNVGSDPTSITDWTTDNQRIFAISKIIDNKTFYIRLAQTQQSNLGSTSRYIVSWIAAGVIK